MALARMLAKSGHDVMVWSALPAEIDELTRTRKHKNLPGMEIPPSIIFTKDIEEVTRDKDILLCAVPSNFVRSTMNTAKDYIEPGQIIVMWQRGLKQILFTQ